LACGPKGGVIPESDTHAAIKTCPSEQNEYWHINKTFPFVLYEQLAEFGIADGDSLEYGLQPMQHHERGRENTPVRTSIFFG
jgi:hypothetical protein